MTKQSSDSDLADKIFVNKKIIDFATTSCTDPTILTENLPSSATNAFKTQALAYLNNADDTEPSIQGNKYYYSYSGGEYNYIKYCDGSWSEVSSMDTPAYDATTHLIIEAQELSTDANNITIGGTGFKFPEKKGIPYNIPSGENITGNSKPHTLTKTGANAYTLTLNGGKINGGLKINSHANITVEVASDTEIINDSGMGLSCSDNLAITGSKTLSVSAKDQAVNLSSSCDLSGFTGKLIMKSTDFGRNTLFSSSTPTFPTAPYRYKENKVSSEVPGEDYTFGEYSYDNFTEAKYLEFNFNPLPVITAEIQEPVSPVKGTVYTPLTGQTMTIKLNGGTFKAMNAGESVTNWVKYPYPIPGVSAKIKNAVTKGDNTARIEIYGIPMAQTSQSPVPFTIEIDGSKIADWVDNENITANINPNTTLDIHPLFFIDDSTKCQNADNEGIAKLPYYDHLLGDECKEALKNKYPSEPPIEKKFFYAKTEELYYYISYNGVEWECSNGLKSRADFVNGNYYCITQSNLINIYPCQCPDAATMTAAALPSSVDENLLLQLKANVNKYSMENPVPNTEQKYYYAVSEGTYSYLYVNADGAVTEGTTTDTPDYGSNTFVIIEQPELTEDTNGGIEISGKKYSVPLLKDIPYNISESGKITGNSIPHTITKTGDNAYTLTLNGGTISSVTEDTIINFTSGTTVTFDIQADTVINTNASIAIGSTAGDNSFFFRGNKSLSVTGEEYSIYANNLNLSDFIGTFKMSSAQIGTDNSTMHIAGSATMPAGIYRYKENPTVSADPGSYNYSAYSYDFSNKNYYFEINCDPYATVGDESIAGTTNTPFADPYPEITVTLGGTTFKEITADTDVSTWFGDSFTATTGLTAKIKGGVSEGTNTATIYFTGTPTAVKSGAINLTISNAFLNISTDIIVDANPSAVWNIAGAPGATITAGEISGTCYSPLIGTDEITINLENAEFNTVDPSNVLNWFTNLPTGLQANFKSEVTAGATSATIIISGTPIDKISDSISISIPATDLQNYESPEPLIVTPDSSAKWNIVPKLCILPGCAIEGDPRYDKLPDDMDYDSVVAFISVNGTEGNKYLYKHTSDGYRYFYYNEGEWKNNVYANKQSGDSLFFINEVKELVKSDTPTGFTLNGQQFVLPTQAGVVYNIPDDTGITSGTPHTLEKTSDGNYTLTLNGGQINAGSNNAIYFCPDG